MLEPPWLEEPDEGLSIINEEIINGWLFVDIGDALMVGMIVGAEADEDPEVNEEEPEVLGTLITEISTLLDDVDWLDG